MKGIVEETEKTSRLGLLDVRVMEISLIEVLDKTDQIFLAPRLLPAKMAMKQHPKRDGTLLLFVTKCKQYT